MNSKNLTWLNTIDRLALVSTLMSEVSNNGFISFEGGKALNNFLNIQGAFAGGTEILKMGCGGPNIIVVPITSETIGEIIQELNLHAHLNNCSVQIESQKKLVFGAYDEFDECATFVSEEIPKKLLMSLAQKGVISRGDFV